MARKQIHPAGIVGPTDYDYKFGVVTKQEGPYFDPEPPSPIRTIYTYDALGRIASSTALDGIVTTVTRSAVVTGCPTFSRYKETTSTTGHPPVTVCFDVNRPVFSGDSFSRVRPP